MARIFEVLWDFDFAIARTSNMAGVEDSNWCRTALVESIRVLQVSSCILLDWAEQALSRRRVGGFCQAARRSLMTAVLRTWTRNRSSSALGLSSLSKL